MSVLLGWRVGVRDSGLPAPAKLLAYTLATYMNGEGEQAWPSVKTLREASGLGERTIWREIRRLESEGWIAVERHERQPSHYFATSPPGASLAPPGASEAPPGASLAPPPGASLAPEVELLKSKTKSKSLTKGESRDFDEFWKVYPHKVDKGAARGAFPAALRRSSLAAILAGAQRYRDDPNRDPQYTKSPATWLRADAWENPPLPSRRTARRDEPLPPYAEED